MAFVNLRDGYTFIHIFKTGGTSIRSLLEGEEILGCHSTAKHTEDHFRAQGALALAKYQATFKFAFVRNPYEWLGSTYAYIRRHPTHDAFPTVRGMNIYEFAQWFAEVAMKMERPHGANAYMTQRAFLYHDGKPMVDFVGRFEALQYGMDTVMSRLNKPARNVPRLNAGRQFNTLYRMRYDARTVMYIRSKFREDFVTFGYGTGVNQ